jgi:hypothetical protein
MISATENKGEYDWENSFGKAAAARKSYRWSKKRKPAKFPIQIKNAR